VSLIDDFKDRFPGFDLAVVDTYIPILEGVYPSYYSLEYNDSTKEATLNLLAHLLVMEMNDSPNMLKSIESKSVGNVSVSYSSLSYEGGELHDFMRGSKYGNRFLILTARRYGGMAV